MGFVPCSRLVPKQCALGVAGGSSSPVRMCTYEKIFHAKLAKVFAKGAKQSALSFQYPLLRYHLAHIGSQSSPLGRGGSAQRAALRRGGSICNLQLVINCQTSTHLFFHGKFFDSFISRFIRKVKLHNICIVEFNPGIVKSNAVVFGFIFKNSTLSVYKN